MKPDPNEEMHDVYDISSQITPNDFKAEVASIVGELGKRLDKLLEQHEACVLRASRNGEHHHLHEESTEMQTSNAQWVPDVVTSMPPMAVEPALLPGCPEAPPRPPDVEPAQMYVGNATLDSGVMMRNATLDSDVLPKDCLGQFVQRTSTQTSASAHFQLEVASRTIWSEEHTDAQQEAISKYAASVRFEAVDKVEAGMRSSAAHRKSVDKSNKLGSWKLGPSKKENKTTSLSDFKPTCAVMHPVGQTRTFWNLISLVLICQDALTVPLLVFEIGDSGPWQVLAWFCTLFWTADMIVSFRTGYFVGVKVEMRPRRIAKQYAMTWLAFDLFIVVFEWFSRFFTSIAPPGVARTTRVVRAVRLLKLLRIAKMKGLVNEFAERLNSNTLALVLNLFILTTFLCVIGHFVACAWFALGQGTSDGWINTDRYAVENDIDQSDFPYWYLSSSRWVICQINGRTDMDETRNMPERGFTVFAGIILSVVGRSVFVALITKSMLQLSELYKKKEERRRCVNDYLSLHPIPTLIERSVKEAVQHYKDMDYERQREGIVLALLPKQLQLDLLCEVRRPLLEDHTLFGSMMHGFAPAARHFCLDVIHQLHTASQERIFKSEDPCSRMLLMDTGTVLYGQAEVENKSSSLITDDDMEEKKTNGRVLSLHDTFGGAAAVTRVTHGMWLSEPALWATWNNKGSLITEDNCRMLEVDAMVLGSALQEHTDFFGLTVIYARHFLKMLVKERHLSDLLSFDVQLVQLDSDK